MVQLPIIATIAATLFAQAAPLELDKGSVFLLAFDWPAQDVGGDPVTSETTEWIFRPATGDPGDEVSVIVITKPLAAGANTFLQVTTLATVPIGEYVLTARVQSTAGTWSDESAPPVEVVVVSKKPQAPTNVRGGVGG